MLYMVDIPYLAGLSKTQQQCRHLVIINLIIASELNFTAHYIFMRFSFKKDNIHISYKNVMKMEIALRYVTPLLQVETFALDTSLKFTF